MDNSQTKESLPRCAAEYIELVAKKVRYRRKVRREVREELAGHFEDALRKCTSDAEKEEAARKLIAEFGDAKTLAKLIRRGKKRCRPVWLKALIRTCQAAGIAIILLIAYIAWFFSGAPYISVDFVAELNRMVIPAADGSLNAEPYYVKAVMMCPNEPNNDVPRPWEVTDAKHLAMIKQWVQSAGPAIEQLRQGNARPHFWRSYSSGKRVMMRGVDLEPLSRYPNLAKLVCWKSVLAASDGDFKEAFRDIEDCYRLGQGLARSVTLAEQINGNSMKMTAVSTAKTIVMVSDISSDDLARFQNDMEAIIMADDFHFSMASDRLYFQDYVQHGFTKSGHICPSGCNQNLSMSLGVTAGEAADTYARTESLLRTILNFGRDTGRIVFTCPNKEQTLEVDQRLSEYMGQVWGKTPYEAMAAGLDAPRFEENLRKGNFFARMFAPEYSYVWRLFNKFSVEARSLPPVIAARRYHIDRGVYPESLEELQRAGYLKALPMDPWSNGPLVYRKTADGYVLYSVGLDFKDDGGKGLDEKGKPIRWWFNTDKGGDIVFWPIPESK